MGVLYLYDLLFIKIRLLPKARQNITYIIAQAYMRYCFKLLTLNDSVFSHKIIFHALRIQSLYYFLFLGVCP